MGDLIQLHESSRDRRFYDDSGENVLPFFRSCTVEENVYLNGGEVGFGGEGEIEED